MSTQLPSSPSRLESGATVSHLHHVGHVVRNIESAIALYRRMGFVVPPPSFPALAPRPGEPVRAFGAGNTHVSLRNSFVELVTVSRAAEWTQTPPWSRCRRHLRC